MSLTISQRGLGGWTVGPASTWASISPALERVNARSTTDADAYAASLGVSTAQLDSYAVGNVDGWTALARLLLAHSGNQAKVSQFVTSYVPGRGSVGSTVGGAIGRVVGVVPVIGSALAAIASLVGGLFDAQGPQAPSDLDEYETYLYDMAGVACAGDQKQDRLERILRGATTPDLLPNNQGGIVVPVGKTLKASGITEETGPTIGCVRQNRTQAQCPMSGVTGNKWQFKDDTGNTMCAGMAWTTIPVSSVVFQNSPDWNTTTRGMLLLARLGWPSVGLPSAERASCADSHQYGLADAVCLGDPAATISAINRGKWDNVALKRWVWLAKMQWLALSRWHLRKQHNLVTKPTLAQLAQGALPWVPDTDPGQVDTLAEQLRAKGGAWQQAQAQASTDLLGKYAAGQQGRKWLYAGAAGLGLAALYLLLE